MHRSDLSDPTDGVTIHVAPAGFAYNRFTDGSVTLDEIAVQIRPVVTLDDVRWYRWEEHSILLTSGARRRLESHDVGQVFVVSVVGERVYGGLLWSSLSSLLVPGTEMSIDPPGSADSQFGSITSMDWATRR